MKQKNILSSLFKLGAGLAIGVTLTLTGCGGGGGSSAAASSSSPGVSVPIPDSIPVVKSISPDRAIAGTSVTINGYNFASTPANNTVMFNGVAATVTAATTSSLTVVVPSGATSGNVVVSSNGLTSTPVGIFSIATPTSSTQRLMGGAIQGKALSGALELDASWRNRIFSLSLDFSGMTTDGVNLYVSVWSTGEIHKINIASGVATMVGSGLDRPGDLTTDGTNLYIVDEINNKIHKMSIATGATSVLAGSGMAGAIDSSIGTAATFSVPTAITTDGVSLYVCEYTNNKVRKIDISTGAVSTLAGSGIAGAVDGLGTAASFSAPMSITTDGLNLYVGEGFNNYKIRTINISTGFVSTLVGSGTRGAVDGIGQLASINTPNGMTTDGSYLYFTDNYINDIRKVNISTGEVTSSGNGGVATGQTGTSSGGGILITTDGVNLYYVHEVHDPYFGAYGTIPKKIFTGLRKEAPYIVSQSTSAVKAGTVAAVEITGQGFDPILSNNTVMFNGTPAILTPSISHALIVATVPSNATTGNLTVSNGSGLTSVGNFSILNSPTVTGITPDNGTTGTSVKIEGTNFDTNASGNQVCFSGTSACGKPLYATSTALYIYPPEGSASGAVTVTTAGGVASGGTFTVPPPPPSSGGGTGTVSCNTAWTGNAADVQVSSLCQTACVYMNAGNTTAKSTTCSVMSATYGAAATSSCSSVCP